MAALRYTLQQLHRLRDSDLVQKPDNLPSIEQWIETPADQRKTRTYSNKIDENDHPVKRPTLFEGRQLSRHSYTGNSEEVFLGPKISFASASAARQPKNQSEAISTADDPKNRNNRDAGERHKDGRERNAERRERYGEYNNQRDIETRRTRNRGDVESEDAQTSGKGRYHNNERDDDEDKDALTGRNNGARKFDQPWFRDGGSKDTESIEHRGWRERERERGLNKDRKEDGDWSRGGKAEYQPKWMQEAGGDEDSMGHTQKDFQKWKEKMKAVPGGTEQTPVEEKMTESITLPADAQPAPKKNDASQLFGFGGDTAQDSEASELPSFFTPAKKEESAASNRAVSGGAKSKSSRFAGFFSPPPVSEAAPPPPATVPVAVLENDASSPNGGARRNTVEDQAGFQRMMQMLRMGGGTSGQSPSTQSPPGNLFGLGSTPGSQGAPPGLREDPQGVIPGRYSTSAGPVESRKPGNSGVDTEVQRPPSKPQEPHGLERRPEPSMHNLASPPFQGRPLSQQLGSLPPLPRPELGTTRDSEFLLKLMQQPRTPVNDGAGGFGQGPARSDPNNITALLNSFANKQPAQPPKPRAPPPPPGFFNEPSRYGGPPEIDNLHPDAHMHRNDRPLPHHDGRAVNMPQPQRPDERPNVSSQPHRIDERMGGLPQSQRLPPLEDFPRHLQQQHMMADQMHQRHLQYDHMPPPQWQQQQQQQQPSGRPSSQQIPHDAIPPPPGFSASRAPAPPAFFPFPGAGLPPPPQQAQGIQRLPPGFPNNMNMPGFPGPGPPPPLQQQPQGLPAGQRRQGNGMPQPQAQGYELYGDPRRGGMPPVTSAAGYQQFVKQQQQQQQHQSYGQGAPY